MRRAEHARRAESRIRTGWVKQRREARSAVVPRLLQAQAGLHLDISAHNILTTLADTGPITISELARRLGSDISTVSRQVLQPEASRLLGRMPSTAAHGASVLHLTEDGQAAVDALMAAWNGLIDPVLSSWSDAEVVQFDDYLHRFVSGLQREIDSRSVPQT